MKKYVIFILVLLMMYVQMFGFWYTVFVSDGSQDYSWGDTSYASGALFAMGVEKYDSDLFLDLFIAPDIDGSIQNYVKNSEKTFSFEPIQYLRKTETYFIQIPFSYVVEMRKFFYSYTNDYSSFKKIK